MTNPAVSTVRRLPSDTPSAGSKGRACLRGRRHPYTRGRRAASSSPNHLRSGESRARTNRGSPATHRSSCYQEYIAKIGYGPPTSLILAGTSPSGTVSLYTFDSPDFVARRPVDDFVVVGSGAGVADYLAEKMRGVDRSERVDLKVRVDRVLSDTPAKVPGVPLPSVRSFASQKECLE